MLYVFYADNFNWPSNHVANFTKWVSIPASSRRLTDKWELSGLETSNMLKKSYWNINCFTWCWRINRILRSKMVHRNVQNASKCFYWMMYWIYLISLLKHLYFTTHLIFCHTFFSREMINTTNVLLIFNLFDFINSYLVYVYF